MRLEKKANLRLRYVVFHAWKDSRTFNFYEVFGCSFKAFAHKYVSRSARFNYMNFSVQKRLKSDWQVYLAADAQAKENDLLSGKSALAHQVLRRAKTTYKPRTGIRVIKDDNSMSMSYAEKDTPSRPIFYFCW